MAITPKLQLLLEIGEPPRIALFADGIGYWIGPVCAIPASAPQIQVRA
jgi:hypothetical protein